MSMDGNWPSGPLAATSLPNEWMPDAEPVGPAGDILPIDPAQQPAPQKVEQTKGDQPPPPAAGPGEITKFLVHHVTETMERAAATYTHDVFVIQSSKPTQILGQVDSRREATILNDPDGSTTVYVGHGNGDGAANRWKLKPGASLTVRSRKPLSCCYDTGGTGTQTVYVWSELNEESDRILGKVMAAMTAPETHDFTVDG